eukprot:scaffold64738_cov66-Cyclotella_meneghiniana.AAC.1
MRVLALCLHAICLSGAATTASVLRDLQVPVRTASFDGQFGAPRCSGAASSCDSGWSLINGRGTSSGNQEQNQPNTIDGCSDGSDGFGYYWVRRIVVSSGSSDPLVPGETATITASVRWKYVSDRADFYYASDAANPQWQYLGSRRPVSVNQDISVTYTLPDEGSETQAVRVQVREGNYAQVACSQGYRNDRDDLVFDAITPSSMPSAQPSESARPSSMPSWQPSESARPSSMPSIQPSESARPSNMPSLQPSESARPSNTPSVSMLPTSNPSQSPSIVIETVTTPGSLSTSQDICSFSEAQLADFVEAITKTIESSVCSGLTNEECYVIITSVCRSGRELRQLQASSWQIEYQVIRMFTCEVAACNSASDIAAVSSIADAVSSDIRKTMNIGAFLAVLSTNIMLTSGLDSSQFTCLSVWGTTEDHETEVHVIEQGTGLYYPDWEYGSCLEDGNQPTYMDNYPDKWISDTLDQCCARFFPENHQCLNLQGSGLWYADAFNKVCVTDCESGMGNTCGGLANVVTDKIYANPRSCCESELGWLFVEFCEVGLVIFTN